MGRGAVPAGGGKVGRGADSRAPAPTPTANLSAQWSERVKYTYPPLYQEEGRHEDREEFLQFVHCSVAGWAGELHGERSLQPR